MREWELDSKQQSYHKLPFLWTFSTFGDIMTALSFDIFRFFATSLKPSTVLRLSCQHKHESDVHCKHATCQWYRHSTQYCDALYAHYAH